MDEKIGVMNKNIIENDKYSKTSSAIYLFYLYTIIPIIIIGIFIVIFDLSSILILFVFFIEVIFILIYSTIIGDYKNNVFGNAIYKLSEENIPTWTSLVKDKKYEKAKITLVQPNFNKISDFIAENSYLLYYQKTIDIKNILNNISKLSKIYLKENLTMMYENLQVNKYNEIEEYIFLNRNNTFKEIYNNIFDNIYFSLFTINAEKDKQRYFDHHSHNNNTKYNRPIIIIGKKNDLNNISIGKQCENIGIIPLGILFIPIYSDTQNFMKIAVFSITNNKNIPKKTVKKTVKKINRKVYESKIICKSCSCKNSMKYSYCINCGTFLKQKMEELL